MEFFVVVRGADKEKSTAGDDGAAVVFRASVMQSGRSKFRVFAEGNFPEIFAGIEIDGVESAPGRSDGGIAIGIEKTVVAGEVIFHGEKWRTAAFQFLTFSAGEEVRDSAGLLRTQVRKAGHATFAVVNGVDDLLES